VTDDPLAWLPPPVTFDGEWGAYEEQLFAIFTRDFVKSLPTFCGKALRLKHMPEYQGKSATFWHLITEGPVEKNRNPNMRRCERLVWVRPMIEAAGAGDGRVVHWSNRRNGESRWVVALPDYSHVVILAERSGYYLPWTAYPVEQPHQRRKLEQEYRSWPGTK